MPFLRRSLIMIAVISFSITLLLTDNIPGFFQKNKNNNTLKNIEGNNIIQNLI